VRVTYAEARHGSDLLEHFQGLRLRLPTAPGIQRSEPSSLFFCGDETLFCHDHPSLVLLFGNRNSCLKIEDHTTEKTSHRHTNNLPPKGQPDPSYPFIFGSGSSVSRKGREPDQIRRWVWNSSKEETENVP